MKRILFLATLFLLPAMRAQAQTLPLDKANRSDLPSAAVNAKVEPAAIALTEKQSAEWGNFATAEQQLQQSLMGIIRQAASVPIGGEVSRDIHSALKEQMTGLDLLGARREKWLAELRLDHNCKGCAIESGKLVKPQAK